MVFEHDLVVSSERTEKITEKDVAKRISKVIDVYKDAGYDPRLIGSFGQQASLKSETFPVKRPNGSYKDIDLTVLGVKENIDTSQLEKHTQEIAYPLGLDTFNRLFTTDDTGMNYIRYKGISLPIRSEVLRMWNGSLAGIDIPTFDPRTLIHLYALYLPMRPKDKSAALHFGRAMRSTDGIAPEELFEPFHKILDIKKKQYPLDTLAGDAQFFYRTHIPDSVRERLHPILGRIKMMLHNK